MYATWSTVSRLEYAIQIYRRRARRARLVQLDTRGRVVGTSKSWSAMGAESSSMKPEGDVQRPPSASTVATEPEHPLRPQPPPGHAHPASRSASLGRSASGGNGLNRMGSDPHLHASGQRRHHTWHNAPKKRVYDQSVWDLQALVARRASTHPAYNYLHV